MKKATIILVVGALLIVLAGTAVAETNNPAPAPNAPNQEFLQQMWNYCHGQNGMMNGYYYGNGNGAAPQGFGGMMGGYGYGSMMGW
ncbi:MAG: hypothetical protein ACOWWO_15270 [Peptococcaceae bacterium]